MIHGERHRKEVIGDHHDHHQRWCQDGVAGHDQAHDQEQHHRDLLDDQIQRVGQNPLEGGPSLLHRRHHALQAGLRQHQARRCFGDVGRRRDGDPHLRLAQRRGVVGAIAAHPDRVPAALECLDELVFPFWEHSGEDGERLRSDSVRDRSRWTDRAVQPDSKRHGPGRRGRIAGHHHGPDAQGS